MARRREHRSEERAAADAERSATVTLTGDALVCAEVFGGGDAESGARFLLMVLGAAWWALTRRDNDQPEPRRGEPTAEEICNEGCLSDGFDETFAWGFGITAHINVKQLCEAAAEFIGGCYRQSVREHPAPDVIMTNAVAVISTAVMNRAIEFGDVLAPRTGRVIIETFRDLVKATLATVEKEFSTLQSVAYTIERRADVSKQIDALFERQFPLPSLVEFSGMRGGATASTTLPELTDEQRTAYAPLVEQLTPLWRRVTAYRRDYPETWAIDVLQLPETTKLSAVGVAAMKAVMAEMPIGRGTLKSSGGQIIPTACAREHARRILGISQRNDKKLIEIVRSGAA